MSLRSLPAAVLVGAFAALLVAPLKAQNVEIKPTKKIKHDKYVITQEEIAERPDLKDGYDVVRLLRNQWLRPSRTSGSALSSFASGAQSRPPGGAGCTPRSTDPYCKEAAGAPSDRPTPTSSGSPYADADGSQAAQFLPVVYIDEIKREGVNDLRSLRPQEIVEMRFLTGTQASGRYGSGHENGAIVVKTQAFKGG